MTILFITHKYPPAHGGMEKQSFELINRFQNFDTTHVIKYEGKERIATFFIKLRIRFNKMLKLYPEIELIHLNDGLMGAMFTMLALNPMKRKVVVTLHGLDVVFR
ncbi:MAG: hypothetical protein IPO92_03575 [Saprospiraceae bacterium]|nr:hypothetical protein [Saprospiraceae bacterium]